MAVLDVQLVPETFSINPDRFEIKISTINKEFADKVVSLIYLAERYTKIASRSVENGTLIFRGSFSTNLKDYIEKNYPGIVSRFTIESQLNSQNTLRIYSTESEFLFDPITKSSKINEDGTFYRYFFELILLD